MFWWPPTKNPSPYRRFLQLTSHSLGLTAELDQRVFSRAVPTGSQFHRRQYFLGFLKARRELYFHRGKEHQEQPNASVQSPPRFSQIHERDELGNLELLSQFAFSQGEPWHFIPNAMPLLSTQALLMLR